MTYLEQRTLAIPMHASVPLALAYGALRAGAWDDVLAFASAPTVPGATAAAAVSSKQGLRLWALALRGRGEEAGSEQLGQVLRDLKDARRIPVSASASSTTTALTAAEEELWRPLWAAAFPRPEAAAAAAADGAAA
jgi:hypothetical protein